MGCDSIMNRNDDPKAALGLAGLDKLQSLLVSTGIRNFSAAEICRLNRARLTSEEPSVIVPPSELWPNIVPTLRLAESIRAAWAIDIGNRGGDVTRCGLSVISGYRPAWYNLRVGGAAKSQHVRFAALDLSPANGEIGRFLKVAISTIDSIGEGNRIVGLGKYDTFVHIDTGRSSRTTWDNRTNRGRADHARFEV